MKVLNTTVLIGDTEINNDQLTIWLFTKYGVVVFGATKLTSIPWQGGGFEQIQRSNH